MKKKSRKQKAKDKVAVLNYFERNARYEGGEYLIQVGNTVLVDKTPRGLMTQYLSVKHELN